MQQGFFKAFRQLHWRFTLSYMLISMLAWLLIELLLIIALGVGLYASRSFLLTTALESNANLATSLLVDEHEPDQAGLAFWLQQQQQTVEKVFSYSGILAIVDKQGRVLTSTGVGSDHVPQGSLLSERLPRQEAALLQTSLMSRGNGGTVTQESASAGMFVFVPLVGPEKQVEGVLVLQAQNLTVRPSLWFGIGVTFLLPASIVIVLCVGAAGAVFGAVTSRPLIRRFATLADAADHWSRGDFSTLVSDPFGDEIGRLTRRLNHMAEQLQQFVRMREEQAALDERGRMARDLHDSIKQQVFALFMQISGAKALLLQERDGALIRLEHAEKLLGQVQDDLTSLIHELRPAMLEGKSFPQALREQVEQWSQRTGIEASFHVEGTHSLSLQLEDALYRLTQEALSNVARHSQARSVHVQLVSQQGATVLKIADDGRGCHVLSKPGKGVGLLSMSERLLPFGGTVHYQSKPGQGFIITAAVPDQGQKHDSVDEQMPTSNKEREA